MNDKQQILTNQSTSHMDTEKERSEAAAERTLERAEALNTAGKLARDQGDLDAAKRLHEESLSIRRELGDKRGIAASLNNLGNVAYRQGDYAAATALHKESLAIKRELGTYTAGSLNNLGLVAEAQGDYVAAKALFEEALAVNREVGNREWEASNLSDLGSIAFHQGDYVAARTLYEESLTIRRELGDKQGISHSLEGFARLAQMEGQPERAGRLLGACEAVGSPLPPEDRREYDSNLAAVREALREEVFAVVWAEGSAMTLEQTIEYALHDLKKGGRHQ